MFCVQIIHWSDNKRTESTNLHKDKEPGDILV